LPERARTSGRPRRGAAAAASDVARKSKPAPGASAAAGPATVRALGARALPTLVPLALSVAAALALYLPALGTSFFAADYLFLDQVRQKPLIAALATPDPLSNFYRPISRQLYFWTVAGASNESARAFHLAGLIAFAV